MGMVEECEGEEDKEDREDKEEDKEADKELLLLEGVDVLVVIKQG